jgi:rhamnulose-1-phosphate aldolase
MALEPPFPELDELLTMVGEAGQRLCDIESTEGAAGNISVYIGWPVEPRRRFPIAQTIDTPIEVPELEGHAVIVTGSGRRLREIARDADGNVGIAVIGPGGKTATVYTSPRRHFARLTSEFNSHLAIHRDQVRLTGTNFSTVIHAQPPYITYLSHIPEYRDERFFNQHIMRWEPETIVFLPEGVGVTSFRVPGSPALMEATLGAMRQHRVIVWGKHGVVARSDTSVKRAADYIEYAEIGARYEYMNLRCGERGEGLTTDEIRAICAHLGVQQEIF